MTVYNFQKIIKESFWLLTLCILVEIIAGQALNSQEDLINIPILLAAVPVVNGIGGNLGSILGARITSGLHVGYIQPNFRDKTLVTNIFSIFALAIIVFFILVILMVFILPLSGISLEIKNYDFTESVIKFVIIVVGSGLIMTFLIVIIGTFSAFWAFKRGMDPDNVVTPIITTSGDLVGISVIVIFVLMIVI